MLKHYLTISLRNLRKYKAQTAISVSAMAVSITLMAIVSSILLSYKPTPLLEQPYIDRVMQFQYKNFSSVISPEDRDIVLGHQFKSVEKIHLATTGVYSMKVTAEPAVDDERSIMVYGGLNNKDYLNFLGLRSVISGQPLASFSEKDVVITQWLAKRLFDNENPIGKTISVYLPYWADTYNGNYTIKDVIEQPSSYSGLMLYDEHVYMFTDQFPSDMCDMFFVLREGASKDGLLAELKELLPHKEFEIVNVNDRYDESKESIVRNGVIVFLFLFVLVTFFNYLRQQLQLFRLREREVALRTCVGSRPKSLFLLFATEVSIVLILTLILTLFLISAASSTLMSGYESIIEPLVYNIYSAVGISMISISILYVIGFLSVILTVRRIRRDQTGLALRMRPIPKHRLRNVGLILQMTVSILFIWITVLILLSLSSIKNWYGIPEDLECYKSCLTLKLEGVLAEDINKIYERIEALESVENVYAFQESMMQLEDNGEFPNMTYYSEISQKENDMTDFFNLKIDSLPGNVNPDRYVVISEEFKQMLEEKDLWNGKTVTLPYREDGVYEILGIFDRMPFKEDFEQKTVIVTDRAYPYTLAYRRIILPKKGEEKEAKHQIMDIIQEVIPSRIDIKPESYIANAALIYNYKMAVINIIYILCVISVVTTMASIYAGVSLDTRRRRKEMALRKLNGATRKVILMIFLRAYVAVLFIAAMLSLPIVLALMPYIIWYVSSGTANDNFGMAFVITLVLITSITFFTIFWKIRDIMRADPIEYLKE